jgi:addiction module RelE/StbE family toxin
MRIIFSELASRDLDNISLYIADELRNQIAARSTINKILQSIYVLRNFPDLGQRIDAKNEFIQNYRFLVIKNYLIIYKMADKGVMIVRVVYAKSDYNQLLKA